MFGMGPWELFLIFVVILLLFGARRLPEIAQGIGKGIKEFRKAMKDTTDEIKGAIDPEETSAGTKSVKDSTPQNDHKQKNG